MNTLPASTRSRTLVLTVGIVIALGLVAQVQRSQAQPTAQVAIGSPLPVFVTNTPALPEGFVNGSRWRFTTWTTPSVITWVGTVNRTSGAWANLTVLGDDGSTNTRWYYIPGLQGSWEQQ